MAPLAPTESSQPRLQEELKSDRLSRRCVLSEAALAVRGKTQPRHLAPADIRKALNLGS